MNSQNVPVDGNRAFYLWHSHDVLEGRDDTHRPGASQSPVPKAVRHSMASLACCGLTIRYFFLSDVNSVHAFCIDRHKTIITLFCLMYQRHPCSYNSTMEALQAAMNTNNQGVAHLAAADGESSNYEAAFGSLTHALRVMKQMIMSASQTADEGDRKTTSQRCSRVWLESCLEGQHLLGEASRISHKDSGVDVFVFYHPLAFQLESCNTCSLKQESLRLYSSVIILNMAIVFHRMASDHSRSNDRGAQCLSKARTLYRKALECLQQDDGLDALIVRVIAANNFAVLLHRDESQLSSRNGYNRMLECLIHDYEGPLGVAFGKSVIDQLLLNIFFWRCPGQTSCSAPAA